VLGAKTAMKRISRAALETALLAGLIAALTLMSTANAGPRHTCGELGQVGEAGPSIVTVKASSVGCRVARRVLEKYLTGSGPRAWECHSAGEEGSCVRGNATATYRAAKRVRRCGSIGFEPNSDNVAGSIQAKRASCHLARRVARGSRFAGATHPAPYRTAGFSCKGSPTESALPSALYVCRKGQATIVFSRT
jgi:hypothetical protein